MTLHIAIHTFRARYKKEWGDTVCFGPDAKSGRDCDLIRIPKIGGHSLAALAIHIRKGGVSITYCWHLQRTGKAIRIGVSNAERGGGGGGGGGWGGGDNFCGRGTISASGLRPWGTISASRLCPGGQNLRGGDRICSDTGTSALVN